MSILAVALPSGRGSQQTGNGHLGGGEGHVLFWWGGDKGSISVGHVIFGSVIELSYRVWFYFEVLFT